MCVYMFFDMIKAINDSCDGKKSFDILSINIKIWADHIFIYGKEDHCASFRTKSISVVSAVRTMHRVFLIVPLGHCACAYMQSHHEICFA